MGPITMTPDPFYLFLALKNGRAMVAPLPPAKTATKTRGREVLAAGELMPVGASLGGGAIEAGDLVDIAYGDLVEIAGGQDLATLASQPVEIGAADLLEISYGDLLEIADATEIGVGGIEVGRDEGALSAHSGQSPSGKVYTYAKSGKKGTLCTSLPKACGPDGKLKPEFKLKLRPKPPVM